MLTDEEKADALHRIKNLNVAQRKLVLKLAAADAQTIEVEGKLIKSWLDLEDAGWVRMRDNGWTGADCVTTINFTLDGWDALCVLLDSMGE